MNNKKCCFSPYLISSDFFTEVADQNIFIDTTKTKKALLVNNHGESFLPPSSDIIVIHEELDLNGKDYRWCEFIHTYGREYNITISLCEIFINSFLSELSNNIILLKFGAEKFCFGKIYSNDNIISSNDNCLSSFDYDEHTFIIKGNSGLCFDLDDCSECNPEIILFSNNQTKGEFPSDIPDQITPVELPITTKITLNSEPKIHWVNDPYISINSDISCFQEIPVISKQICQSQNNPCISILPSGHSIIAYETRLESGLNQISLAVLKSSVQNKIFYFRSLSRGRLLNDSSFIYGGGTFEIYDDLVFPVDTLYIGFLSGPLEGTSAFLITNITRDTNTDRVKHIIKFNSLGRFPIFKDTNDANDISFFILTTTDSLPSADNLINILNVPPHIDSSGNQVPVAYPSISVATNNLMIDGCSHVYLSYQAFENGIWNIYLKQLRICDNVYSPPIYKAPYDDFNPKSTSFVNIDQEFLVYRLVDKYIQFNSFYLLFEIFTKFGQRVYNCNKEDVGSYQYPFTNFTVDRAVATLFVNFSTDIECNISVNIGDEFEGRFPINSTNFFLNPSGLGSQHCISNFSTYPDEGNWCYFKIGCRQFSVFDDPYCPSPYLSCQYNPEDLWLLKNGEEIISRVKYHVSITHTNARILERNNPGYNRTFIKNAEIIITYKKDLLDLWTNKKDLFVFSDIPPLDLSNPTKGLTNFPFNVEEVKIYGLDSVHLIGNVFNWVYFLESASLQLDYPNIGSPGYGQADSILISSNSSRSKIKVNNRNDVFIIYENNVSDASQIEIKGTGDFSQDSITGPKGNRLTRFITLDDFKWSQKITEFNNRINRFCDMFIDKNDVVHITWQSNRDNYWEIYYANAFNLFEPVRLTKYQSRSSFPRINVNDKGHIYVVFQDDRFGQQEIMLTFKNEVRILPLLQQDAYLASLNNSYIHYTNIMSFMVDNNTNKNELLNIKIEFYNNIGLYGAPQVLIDSRDNLEAFIDEELISDPYVSYKDAGGIFIHQDQSEMILFNASQFRPGKLGYSYPYSFNKNQTYFPKIYTISQDGRVTLLTTQHISFSCNKCSRLSSNLFDISGCSFSFTYNKPGYVNFSVDVYEDQEFTRLKKSYIASHTMLDLQFFEVNNKSADSVWTPNGLKIDNGKSPFIQLYPSFDTNSDLICGINYYIKVYVCSTNDCSDKIEIESTSGIFYCECSSNIFEQSIQNLNDISRWQSSANGYSDMRLTDSIASNNKIHPTIQSFSQDESVVVFEEISKNQSKIRGSTFNNIEQNDLKGSGTKSWFDYDFGINGIKPEICSDIYDRTLIIYEREDPYNGRNVSDNELKNSSIIYRVCDFELPNSQAPINTKCNISLIESNLLSKDNLLFNEIIKKIQVSPKNVDYYTYNADGNSVPIVSSCLVQLQIWGTPEVVAYRLRNDNQTEFLDWCPFSNEISDYYTEVDCKISPGSGIKFVCVQVMTYSGITSEYCLQIIADFVPIAFDLNLYSDSNFTIQLPKFNGYFVGLGLFDFETKTVMNQKTIFIEIMPNINIENESISFDIIQQGIEDQFNLPAAKSISSNGRLSYRGQFIIKREDNVLNKDGLTSIKVKFPESCFNSDFTPSNSMFNKDKYNMIIQDSKSSTEQSSDVLSKYRQDTSGRIGVDIVIKPTEDPYLIFGNPSFYFNEKVK